MDSIPAINAVNIPAPRSERVHRMAVDEKTLVAMIPEIRPYSHIFYTDPANTNDLVDDWLPSKLWRMNNLYSVQTKDDGSGNVVVKFVMKLSQLVLYATLKGHPRVVVLKSRQIGISTVTVLMYGDDMLVIPHLKVGIVAQNQDAANDLKSKISFAFDSMDDEIKAFIGVHSTTDNDSAFGLSNGSHAVARLSFRSGTLHRFAWTEVGKIAARDPQRVTETLSGSMQAIAPTASNWVVNESTAEGDNYFKSLYEDAEKSVGSEITMKEVRPLFFSWLIDTTCNSSANVKVTPQVKRIVEVINKEFSVYIQSAGYKGQIGNFIYPPDFEYEVTATQQAWMVGALKELNFDMELFYREYPHTPKSAFFASSVGMWYKTAMTEMILDDRVVYTRYEDGDTRLTKPSLLYNPEYEVMAIADIGYKDRFFILYVQILPTDYSDKEGLEVWDIRILGEDWGTDSKTDVYAGMIHEQPYDVRTLVLPHDGDRGTVLKDSVSVVDDFIQMGFDAVGTDRPTKLLPPILKSRRQLYNTRIDGSACPELMENLTNYKKKYDKVLQIYTDVPVHDIHSHGADAYRYVATCPFPSSKIDKASSKIHTYSGKPFNGSSTLGTVGI